MENGLQTLPPPAAAGSHSIGGPAALPAPRCCQALLPNAAAKVRKSLVLRPVEQLPQYIVHGLAVRGGLRRVVALGRRLSRWQGRYLDGRRGLSLGGRDRRNATIAAAAAQSLLDQVAQGFAELAAEQALSAAVGVASVRPAAGAGLVSG